MSENDDDDIRNAADLIAALERARAEWSRKIQEAQIGGPGWDSIREEFHDFMRLLKRLNVVLRCEGCLHHAGTCYSLNTRGRLVRREFKAAESVTLGRAVGPDVDGAALAAHGEAEDRSC